MNNKYKIRKKIAEWLNLKGYNLELDKDGFWMEDYDFQGHKTKEVLDLIFEYHKLQELESEKSSTISRQEIIRQLEDQDHPEKVEDVIFWALDHYAKSEPKGTLGRIIASSIVQSIKDEEERIRTISN